MSQSSNDDFTGKTNYKKITDHDEDYIVREKIDTASVTSSLYSSTGESGLTGGTRVNITPKKRIKKKHKYIKPPNLSPFIPENKILLNEDNDDNP